MCDNIHSSNLFSSSLRCRKKNLSCHSRKVQVSFKDSFRTSSKNKYCIMLLQSSSLTIDQIGFRYMITINFYHYSCFVQSTSIWICDSYRQNFYFKLKVVPNLFACDRHLLYPILPRGRYHIMKIRCGKYQSYPNFTLTENSNMWSEKLFNTKVKKKKFTSYSTALKPNEWQHVNAPCLNTFFYQNFTFYTFAKYKVWSCKVVYFFLSNNWNTFSLNPFR